MQESIDVRLDGRPGEGAMADADPVEARCGQVVHECSTVDGVVEILAEMLTC